MWLFFFLFFSRIWTHILFTNQYTSPFSDDFYIVKEDRMQPVHAPSTLWSGGTRVVYATTCYSWLIYYYVDVRHLNEEWRRVLCKIHSRTYAMNFSFRAFVWYCTFSLLSPTSLARTNSYKESFATGKPPLKITMLSLSLATMFLNAWIWIIYNSPSGTEVKWWKGMVIGGGLPLSVRAERRKSP